jgi:hypothetical protein
MIFAIWWWVYCHKCHRRASSLPAPNAPQTRLASTLARTASLGPYQHTPHAVLYQHTATFHISFIGRKAIDFDSYFNTDESQYLNTLIFTIYYFTWFFEDSIFFIRARGYEYIQEILFTYRRFTYWFRTGHNLAFRNIFSMLMTRHFLATPSLILYHLTSSHALHVVVPFLRSASPPHSFHHTNTIATCNFIEIT